MRERLTLCALACAAALLATPAAACPLTIQSVLFDHDRNVLTPGPEQNDPNGGPIQNGDFLIWRIPDAFDTGTGDGIDDRTNGLFDFRADPVYAAFSAMVANPEARLTAAVLQFVLTPTNSALVNDQFNLENGTFYGEPEIGNQLTNNPFIDPASGSQATLVTLNLLDYYTQEQLVNYLSNGTGDFVNDGRIAFTYADDAIVSGASMRLTAVIPEPGAGWLAVAALGAAAAVTRRGRPAR